VTARVAKKRKNGVQKRKELCFKRKKDTSKSGGKGLAQKLGKGRIVVDKKIMRAPIPEREKSSCKRKKGKTDVKKRGSHAHLKKKRERPTARKKGQRTGDSKEVD